MKIANVSINHSVFSRQTLEEAMAAREAGITLIVVAVSDWVNDNEVKEIATDPDERNVLRVVNFNQMDTITQQLAGILCNSTLEIFILIT